MDRTNRREAVVRLADVYVLGCISIKAEIKPIEQDGTGWGLFYSVKSVIMHLQSWSYMAKCITRYLAFKLGVS